jgi:glycosyltransferase involved in cell wall biosynthesis
MPELIEPGVTGDLVPANDPDALASVLARYVTDPQRGFGMRARSREVIETRFSPARHLERIDVMYAEAGRALQRRAA